MKTEAQQIAIAEACGWKYESETDFWRRGDRLIHGEKGKGTHLPDYPNDLNAAVTLCDFLADQGWNCDINNGLDKTWECTFAKDDEVHYAPADTLAAAISQAFLRTLGKWEGQ